MAFKRYATAYWEGDLKSGKGAMSTPQSGLFDGQRYSYNTRFGEEKGTNPEELLAAAHAGCFSMALSLTLAGEGLTAEEINTTCTVTIERGDGGFEIKGSHLVLRAKIPGADKAAFDRAAQAAKGGCPVSKLYKADITLDATLEN